MFGFICLKKWISSSLLEKPSFSTSSLTLHNNSWRSTVILHASSMKLDVSADSFLSCFCISATMLFKGCLIAKVFKLYTITIYAQILSFAMSLIHDTGRSWERFFLQEAWKFSMKTHCHLFNLFTFVEI